MESVILKKKNTRKKFKIGYRCYKHAQILLPQLLKKKAPHIQSNYASVDISIYYLIPNGTISFINHEIKKNYLDFLYSFL